MKLFIFIDIGTINENVADNDLTTLIKIDRHIIIICINLYF